MPRFAYYRLRYTVPLLAAVLAWLWYKGSSTPNPTTQMGRLTSHISHGAWVVTDAGRAGSLSIAKLKYSHNFRVQSAEAMRYEDSTWTTYWADERSPLGFWLNFRFQQGKAVLLLDTRHRHTLGWDYQAGRFKTQPDTLSLELNGRFTPLGNVQCQGKTLVLIAPVGDTLGGLIPLAELGL